MVMYDYAKRQKKEVSQRQVRMEYAISVIAISLGIISLPITLCYMFIEMTGGF